MEAEQFQDYPMPPQPYLNGHSSEGSIRYQIEVEPQLQELQRNLMGEVPVIKNNQVFFVRQKGFKPLINEMGVKRLISFMRMNLSKIFVLSSFNDEQIANITKDFSENIKDNLLQNWDDYEIPDDTAASLVLHTLSDAYYATLQKGKNATYLRYLQTTQSVQEVQHNTSHSMQRGLPSNPQQNASFFKRFLGGR